MLALALPILLVSPLPLNVEGAAMALLRQSAGKTYALQTYRAECHTTVTSDDPKVAPQFELATLRAAKPNKMRYEHWSLTAEAAKTWANPLRPPEYVFACAGNVWNQQFGKILRDDNLPAPDRMSTLLEPWGGFYDVKGSAFGEARGAVAKGQLVAARIERTETVGGVRCRRVSLATGGLYNGQAFENREIWSIGPDGLVRRLVTTYRFGDGPATHRDATVLAIRKNEPIPEAAYAYAPPPGIKRYADVVRPDLLPNGSPAPDFEAIDAKGKPVRLSDLKGKVVVLDFWATWCGPCMASMPHNQEVIERLQAEGLPVALLAVDDAESRDAFLRVAKSTLKNYPNLWFLHIVASNSASKLYRVSSIPTQVVVGRDGTIRSSSMGYDGPTGELEKVVREAVAASQ